MKPQQESLQSALDLVVGTPGRLVQHLKEGNLSLNEVKYLVSIIRACLTRLYFCLSDKLTDKLSMKSQIPNFSITLYFNQLLLAFM